MHLNNNKNQGVGMPSMIDVGLFINKEGINLLPLQKLILFQISLVNGINSEYFITHQDLIDRLKITRKHLYDLLKPLIDSNLIIYNVINRQKCYWLNLPKESIKKNSFEETVHNDKNIINFPIKNASLENKNIKHNEQYLLNKMSPVGDMSPVGYIDEKPEMSPTGDVFMSPVGDITNSIPYCMNERSIIKKEKRKIEQKEKIKMEENKMTQSKDEEKITTESKQQDCLNSDSSDNKDYQTANEQKLLTPLEQVFEFYKFTLNHPRYKLDTKRKKIITKALQLYSVQELCQCIIGVTKSAWHMGIHPKTEGKKYDSIELIFRDSEHIDKFIELSTNEELDYDPRKHAHFHDGLTATSRSLQSAVDDLFDENAWYRH